MAFKFTFGADKVIVPLGALKVMLGKSFVVAVAVMSMLPSGARMLPLPEMSKLLPGRLAILTLLVVD